MFKSQKIKDKDKPTRSQRGGVRQGWGSMLVRKTQGNKIRNYIRLLIRNHSSRDKVE